jgi:hypothetical protein
MVAPDASPQASRKIFCIGRNKSGTTSLAAALDQLGFRLGSKMAGQALLVDWVKRDFRPIARHCRTADAFHDIPFSLDFTFQAMDMVFPGSRFILSVRSSPEEWYESYIRFHTQVVGKGMLPTPERLKRHPFVFRGFFWLHQTSIFGIDESTLYDREIYINNYVAHNERVQRYFKYRPADLLVLDLSAADSMRTLCTFLEVPWTGQAMPHLNQTVRA